VCERKTLRCVTSVCERESVCGCMCVKEREAQVCVREREAQVCDL